MNDSDAPNSHHYADSSDEEASAGKFVRCPRRATIISSSDDSENEVLSDVEEVPADAEKEALRSRYNLLLRKLQNQRQKQKLKLKTRRLGVSSNRANTLAERIKGWNLLELEKHDDHRQQYHAWQAFKAIVEANWTMYGINEDQEKLICLQTKCKGFISELINSIHRAKPNFDDVWKGLETRFYAPINSAEETSLFYQMKQKAEENIFDFFERVTKQAYICNFPSNDNAKHIGEIFTRNCLNPAYFLGIFDTFDDLDKLKQHAKNFHAALPQIRNEPVLAINHQRPSFNVKRKYENDYNTQPKRRFIEPTNSRKYHGGGPCKYCGETNCTGRNCRARGQRCNYCGRYDHFERACLKKKYDAKNRNSTVNAILEEEEHEEKVKIRPN